MPIDIIVVVLLIMAAFKGLRKGLILGIFSFLAFIIGLAAALKLSVVAASYIGQSISISQRWLPVIAFALVFIVVSLLIRLGARILEKMVQVVMLGWLNRLGGVILFALIYLFIFSIVLFYAVQLHIVRPETTQASATYPYLEPLAPKIMNGLGTIIPWFKNMFAELLDFFSGVADNNAPQHHT